MVDRMPMRWEVGNTKCTVQLDNPMIRRSKSLDGLEGDLDKRDDHDDREDEHAQRLKPPPADGIAVLVLLTDQPGGDPDDDGREEVEKGVNQAGQH